MTDDESKIMIKEMHEAMVGTVDGTKRGFNLRLVLIEKWKKNVNKVLATIITLLGVGIVNLIFKLF